MKKLLPIVLFLFYLFAFFLPPHAPLFAQEDLLCRSDNECVYSQTDPNNPSQSLCYIGHCENGPGCGFNGSIIDGKLNRCLYNPSCSNSGTKTPCPNPSPTLQDGCYLSTKPEIITTDTKRIDQLIIQSPNIPDGKYYVYIDGSPLAKLLPLGVKGIPELFEKNNGSIIISNVSSKGFLIDDSNNYAQSFKLNFDERIYKISIQRFENGKIIPSCNAMFITVKKSDSQISKTNCTMEFSTQPNPSKFTTSNNIFIKVPDLQPGQEFTTNGRRLIIEKKDQKQTRIKDFCVSVEDLKTGRNGKGKDTGTYDTGNYIAKLTSNCTGINEELVCTKSFNIVRDCAIVKPGEPCPVGGPIDEASQSAEIFPTPPCVEYEPNTGKCNKVTTAIGDINTKPEQIIRSLMGILLSLSGGIVLALIIYSGYKILTSQGNAEQIQAARETITSAIVGLLFIIFSLVIYQVIVSDILRLPGF